MGEDWLVSAAKIRVHSLSVAWWHASHGGLRQCGCPRRTRNHPSPESSMPWPSAWHCWQWIPVFSPAGDQVWWARLAGALGLPSESGRLPHCIYHFWMVHTMQQLAYTIWYIPYGIYHNIYHGIYHTKVIYSVI
jgi:hypothetical protein